MGSAFPGMMKPIGGASKMHGQSHDPTLSISIALLGLVILAGCAPSVSFIETPPMPFVPQTPYYMEMRTDTPQGLWRLDGELEGALEVELDGAEAFEGKDFVKLGVEEFGGYAWGFEAWLKDIRGGTLLSYSVGEPGDEEVGTVLSVACRDGGLEIALLGERVVAPAACGGPKGAWQHLAVTWQSQGGTLKVIESGQLIWQGVLASGRSLEVGGALFLGQAQGCVGGCLSDGLLGAVDEVAVYDWAIPPSRLLSHNLVARGLRPPTPEAQSFMPEVQLQAAHGSGLTDVAFSPDGQHLAISSTDDLIEIRQPTTGRLIHVLDHHDQPIEKVAFTPDARRLVSIAIDKTVKIWDLADGALLHDLRLHARRLRHLDVSWDGRFAVSADDKALHIWDIATGTSLHRAGMGLKPAFVAFVPKSTKVVVHDGAKGLVLIDAETGERRGMTFDLDALRGAAFGPEGRRVALISRDMKVHIVNLEEGKLIQTFDPGVGIEGKRKNWLASASNYHVDWSPDGELIASSGLDGEVWLWGVKSGEKKDLTAHEGGVTAIVFSPDSGRLATGDRGEEVLIHDIGTGGVRVRADVGRVGLTPMAFSPDGKLLAVAGKAHMGFVLDAEVSSKPIHIFEPQHSSDYKAVFSPNGQLMLTLGQGIHLWDGDTGQVTGFLQQENSGIPLGLFSHKGDLVVTGLLEEGVFHVNESATGKLVATLPCPGMSPFSAAFSQDDKTLVTLVVQNSRNTKTSVRIWDPRSGELLKTLDVADNMTRGMVVSPDGRWLVLESLENRLDIIDMTTGAKAHTLNPDEGYSPYGVFSPDGKRLAAYQHRNITIWDVETWQRLHTIEAHRRTINKVAFSPDASKLASVSWDGMVKLWDVEKGTILQEAGVEGGHASDVSYSPLGDQFATAGTDRRVTLWNNQMEVVGRKEIDETILGLRFSPEGKRVVASSHNGLFHVFNLDVDKRVTLVAKAQKWLAYTPEGYFDASPNGTSLVAMTQGPDAFGIDQQALTHNRPDILIDRLATKAFREEARASQLERLRVHYEARYRLRLKKANTSERDALRNNARPQANILRSSEGAKEGHWRLLLAFRDVKGLMGYQIYVNDVPLYESPRPLEGRRAIVDESLELSGGDNKIEVSATNENGVESFRSLTLAKRKNAPKGKLIFLGFGVSDYEHNDDINDLQYAHQDVLDLAAAFKAAGEDFESVHIRTWINAEVTPQAIKSAKSHVEGASIHDTLVLFVAGHGVRDMDKARTYYYLTHGARLSDLAGTAIRFEEIEKLLYDAPIRKKLFFMDTCQSGEIDTSLESGGSAKNGEGTRGLKARSVGLASRSAKVFGAPAKTKPLPSSWLQRDRFIYMDLARRSGAVVFSSSRGREYSLEGPQFENGAFTEEILNAMRTPSADKNKDGKVSTNELRAYVSDAVPRITDNRQHPTVDRDNLNLDFDLPIITE